jgi:hypothetical protein
MNLTFPENGKRAMGGFRAFGAVLLGIAAGALVLAATGVALIFTLFCAAPLWRLRQG